MHILPNIAIFVVQKGTKDPTHLFDILNKRKIEMYGLEISFIVMTKFCCNDGWYSTHCDKT